MKLCDIANLPFTEPKSHFLNKKYVAMTSDHFYVYSVCDCCAIFLPKAVND